MAAKTFTFKTHKPTGRYRSFDSASHEIKLGGKCVGKKTRVKNRIFTV